jgi:hypothetical protein
MAKRKSTNNHLQSTTQKTKDRATRTALITGGELMYSGKFAAPHVTPVVLLLFLVINRVISHEWDNDIDLFIQCSGINRYQTKV